MAQESGRTTGLNYWDDLLTNPGGIYPLTQEITILSGQNVLRGTVLGKITASGKYGKSLSASADGSEVPAAILAKDVDATAGDREDGVAYFRGQFNENKLILGTAHTISSIKAGLFAKDIVLETTVKSPF